MLEIKNVTYGYSAAHNVLENFSLSFSESGVYGLLGKNGTGKSTILYLIMGLLHPRKGEVILDGQYNTKHRKPEALREMFIVPEEYNLPSVSLKAYVKSIKPLYPNFSEELMAEMLELFDMPQEINLGSLSMGQKKKVYMCVALAARTKYLFMDEPTNGLDIPSKSQFRKVVARGMRDDQIVVISTHQVRDVEQLLDHVTIINNNKVLYNGAIDMDKPLDLEQTFIELITRAEMEG